MRSDLAPQPRFRQQLAQETSSVPSSLGTPWLSILQKLPWGQHLPEPAGQMLQHSSPLMMDSAPVLSYGTRPQR